MKVSKSKIFGVLYVLVFVLYFTVSVRADGMIIPEPHPGSPPVPNYLEIKYHHVNIIIDNQYAETKVDQVFHNPYNRNIEGTYIFPLPANSMISKFSMYVDNEELTGEILEKDKARRIYEEIVRRMKDPALLEYVDRNMFRARVYPIEAYSDKRIKIEYSELIECENNVCKYTYPLDTERFSSKDIESVVITVELNSNRPIKSIYSPSHDISITRVTDHTVRVSYEESYTRPDINFELIYTLSEDDIGLDVIAHRLGGEGHFMMLLSPRFDVPTNELISKDIVFVLDTSGSMSGEKIQQAKDALKYCVNSLNSGDRFNLIGFSDSVAVLGDGMIKADYRNRERAIDFIDGFSASGGTNIHDALLDALTQVDYSGNPTTIVFLTDGIPTVGVTNVDSIVNAVQAKNDGVRIFVFGVGYDVNTHLLDKLSENSRGYSEYVTPDEDIEVKVSGFYAKINNPVLSELHLEFTGVKAYDLYPRELPDLYQGSQIIVVGRYSDEYFGILPQGRPSVTLTGVVNGETKTFKYDVSFPREAEGNEFVPRVWAGRRIGYLLDEIRLHGEDDGIVNEIIELSLEYGIMTPYTSFLVTIGDDVRSPSYMDKANDMFDLVLSGAEYQSQIGKSAVDNAQATRELKENEQMIQNEVARYVGSKNFLLKDEVWTDNSYDETLTVNNIKYDSEAYYALLNDHPEFGRYMSLGEKVVFCDGSECYVIGGEGSDYQPTSTRATTTTTLPHIKLSGEGDFCGGIAAIQCNSGLECLLDGSYPDAGGVCISDYVVKTPPARDPGCWGLVSLLSLSALAPLSKILFFT